MFGLLVSIFRLRRTLGLGVAVAGLIVALTSHFKAPNQQIAPGVAQASVEAETVPGETEKMAYETSESEEKSDTYMHDEVFQKLELDQNGFNWQKDWWKYLSMLLVGILAVFCAIRLTKLLFRLMVFVASVVIGTLGAFVLGPLLTPIIQPHIPEGVLAYLSPEHIGYITGFVLAYLLCSIVMGFLPKAVRDGVGSGK